MHRSPDDHHTALLVCLLGTGRNGHLDGLIAAIVARYAFSYEGPLFFVAGLSHGIVFLGYAATVEAYLQCLRAAGRHA